jgi:hypothetical protein
MGVSVSSNKMGEAPTRSKALISIWVEIIHM